MLGWQRPLSTLAGAAAVIAVLVFVLLAVRTTNHHDTGDHSELRDLALWPFSIMSPWNEPIGRNATYTSRNDPRTVGVASSTGAINSSAFSEPVYQAKVSDPLATVTSPDQVLQYRIPGDASPAKGSDATMLVINPSRTSVDECWMMKRTGSNAWTCGYHARTGLDGVGVLDGGIRASGVSALGGLIRDWEWQQLSIRHALALALPGANLRSGWVWPAQSQDVSPVDPYHGAIPMGSLLAIPTSVDLRRLRLTPSGLAVATALQDYGAYVVDEADQFALYAQPGSSAADVAAASEDLGVIRPLLRVVTNNSPTSPGGGGLPVTSLAPPAA